VPVVELSDAPRQCSVFGVICSPDSGNTATFALGNIRFEQPLAGPRITVNASGEGAIWVSDVNGPVRNGDLLCSSTVPGYAMRQDDDVRRSYTVAKVTCDCDFGPRGRRYRTRVVDVDGRRVRCAFLGCVYSF